MNEGDIRFFSDLEFPDQYHGVLIRSSIQRGHLVDIKPPKLPDGYHLYTATDIPGENRITAMGTSIPIFAPYEIQYYGEPLGILVGPDLDTVLELVSEVLIETETLEPYEFGEIFASSQVVGKRILISGDPDASFADVASVYESTSEIGPQDHYYAEPLGVNVSIANGKLEVYTATQWPFHVRTAVSAVLDLDPSDIVVFPMAIGEAMDGKIWFPSLLAAQASLAAVLCKKPVKIAFSRQEDFLFSVKSAPSQIRYRTSIASDGSIDAMIVRILINAGAYCPLIDEIVDRITTAATGLYMIRSYRVETYALRTNLPPMGALSGWGEGHAIFALETHIASIISQRGLSPLEWKLMNMAVLGQKTPIVTASSGNYRYDELFSAICTSSDYLRKYTAYEYLNHKRKGYRDGPLRGIGLACGFQGNGFSGKHPGTSTYSVEITMETGGQVHIRCGSNSESMRQIIRAIAANSLGIEESLIRFTGTDTESMPQSGPDTLSSKTTILAPLIEKCCATIQRQRFRDPLPITVKKTWKPSLKEASFMSLTPAACAVEIELDPATYEACIRGIWLSCDAGLLYNKHVALTAVKKAIPVALSKMTAEQITIRDGKIAPKQSVQYEVLTPSMQPECEVTFLESGEQARGIGSLAINLIPAAYAIALAQITGRQITGIPVDAETLYSFFESEATEK